MGEEMIFASIGICAVLCVFAWGLYQIFRSYKSMNDKEEMYGAAERTALQNYGVKKKGIDITKEMLKRKILVKKEKSFRRKLEEEVYDDFFGKDKT